MKKKLILALAVSAFGIASYAFAPSVPLPPETPGITPDTPGGFSLEKSVKGPLAPATLLLLGLAGGFAGVKVYRNNKKREE